MSKQFVATTKNNKSVYVDTEASHAATHLADMPNLLGLVQEILANTTAEVDDLKFETDMKRIVGTTDLVETTDTDEIVYAKRLNREEYTRFVKNRKAQPCSTVVVHIEKDGDDYRLISAWIGYIAFPFPGSKYEVSESREYWSHHALVWGNQATQHGTETPVSPW